MTENMAKAINKQINAEFYSAFLYLSMSAYLEEQGLKGFAKWMKAQFMEEQGHAVKFFNFLTDRGERVELEAIDKPQVEWKSALEVFQHVLKHEKHVTDLINNLATLAQKDNDHMTLNMLQWFINEQVEEEANASEYVQKLKLAGDNINALFMLDTELGARAVILPPSISGIPAAGTTA